MMRLIAPFLASVFKKKHTEDLQQLKVKGVRVQTMQLMCAGGCFGSVGKPARPLITGLVVQSPDLPQIAAQ